MIPPKSYIFWMILAFLGFILMWLAVLGVVEGNVGTLSIQTLICFATATILHTIDRNEEGR